MNPKARGESTLYHETLATSAKSILMNGFSDIDAEYETEDGARRKGVWFSARPLGSPHNAWSTLKVVVNLSERDLETFLWSRAPGQHRFWLIPASFVNAHLVRCSPLTI
jgi:hypothetical protein